MTEQAVDISQYTFTASDHLLLDTSVWLLIYGPQVPGDSRVALYSGALKRMLEAKSRLYVDVVILSEFINTYARMKQKIVAPRLKFKDFRRTAAFQTVANDVVADTKQMMKQCVWVTNDLELSAVDGLLDEYALGKSDFNDQIISVLCSQNGLKLVTDDSDFKDRDIPILTANSQLLI